MATMLRECPRSMGFMGSDRYYELDEDIQEWIRFMTVADTAIRFAMATVNEKVESTLAKLERPQELVIATTYPRKAVAAVAELWQVDAAEASSFVEPVYLGGSLESKPRQVARVDAILDVVDTGRTIVANELTVVADDLGTIDVGAVWREAQ